MGSKNSSNNKQKGKEKLNEKISLKIHICGESPRKNNVIESLFNGKKISNKKYVKRATREFKN